jgi:hypothetical protein
MLGKLMKYEIKATARVFLPMYVGLLVLAGLNRLMIQLPLFDRLSFLKGIAIFLYVLMCIATFALTFFVMIQRFYKNLLSDEGYLMFTLPVRPSRHILSKWFTSLLWLVFSTLAFLLSLWVFGGKPEFFQQIPTLWNTMLTHLNAESNGYGALLIAEFIVAVFLSLGYSILMIYASIAIGHTFRSHRVLASFGAFLVLDIIVQVLTSMFTLLPFFTSHMDVFSNDVMPPDVLQYFATTFLPSVGALITVFGAVFFFVTNQIFKKKLNLE